MPSTLTVPVTGLMRPAANRGKFVVHEQESVPPIVEDLEEANEVISLGISQDDGSIMFRFTGYIQSIPPPPPQ